jgi:hypothetical protein
MTRFASAISVCSSSDVIGGGGLAMFALYFL